MIRKGMIACLAGFVLVGALAGCRPAGGDIGTSPYAPENTKPGDYPGYHETEPPATEPPTTEPPATEPPVTEEPTLPVPTEPNSVAVETPYGYLLYQDQWVDFMRVEQQMEEEILTVRFYAVINEKEYSLFTLTIGEETDSPVGQITDGEGTVRNVLVRVHEIEMDESLTDGEQNRLFAMQEDINYVLDKLH